MALPFSSSVDGVYVKAGLEKEKAAVLVVAAALSDGSKVVVSAVPGYRESTENWSDVLRDMRRRGLECPRLVVGDGHLGIWGALRNVYPQAAEQRCWNHKIVNVLAKLPKRQQDQAKLMLRTIPYGGYVNRCVNDIRRRPSQPLIQWRFHPHTVHRDRRLRSTQGPSDA